MDKIKVLFADIYLLRDRLKGELKMISKANEEFLLTGDGQRASEIAGEIIEYASRIQAIAQVMIEKSSDYMK